MTYLLRYYLLLCIPLCTTYTQTTLGDSVFCRIVSEKDTHYVSERPMIAIELFNNSNRDIIVPVVDANDYLTVKRNGVKLSYWCSLYGVQSKFILTADDHFFVRFDTSDFLRGYSRQGRKIMYPIAIECFGEQYATRGLLKPGEYAIGVILPVEISQFDAPDISIGTIHCSKKIVFNELSVQERAIYDRFIELKDGAYRNRTFPDEMMDFLIQNNTSHQFVDFSYRAMIIAERYAPEKQHHIYKLIALNRPDHHTVIEFVKNSNLQDEEARSLLRELSELHPSSEAGLLAKSRLEKFQSEKKDR